MSGNVLSRVPLGEFQGKIACHGGELYLTYEDGVTRAYLIKPSGELESAALEDFSDFLSNTENIQAFLVRP